MEHEGVESTFKEEMHALGLEEQEYEDHEGTSGHQSLGNALNRTISKVVCVSNSLMHCYPPL